METLHSLGPVVLAQLLAAHSGAGGGMFMGSRPCSPDPLPRTTSSLLHPAPPPGRLAMIVTEYMENGSLDAFLRVRAPLCFPHGPGEGSSVWVMGDHVRPPNTPSSPELGPNRLGEGGARRGAGQSIQVPFSPHHVKALLLWVLPPCPAHRLRAVPLWVPRAPPSWEA